MSSRVVFVAVLYFCLQSTSSEVIQKKTGRTKPTLSKLAGIRQHTKTYVTINGTLPASHDSSSLVTVRPTNNIVQIVGNNTMHVSSVPCSQLTAISLWETLNNTKPQLNNDTRPPNNATELRNTTHLLNSRPTTELDNNTTVGNITHDPLHRNTDIPSDPTNTSHVLRFTWASKNKTPKFKVPSKFPASLTKREALPQRSNDTIYHDKKCFKVSFEMVGLLPGKTELKLQWPKHGRHRHHSHDRMDTGLTSSPDRAADDGEQEHFYTVSVVRGLTVIDHITFWVDTVLVGAMTFVLSFKVSFDDVRSIMKKPIAPAVALCCQFAVTPLLAYGLGMTFNLDPAFRMGIFSLGCSPPGGVSYAWAYLLGADYTLSLLMALISTVLSFGFIHAWMYTLGRTLSGKMMTIPFMHLGVALGVMVMTCAAGLLVRRYIPSTGYYISKLTKPVAMMLTVSLLILLPVSQKDVFSLMYDWRLAICMMLLPYLGAFLAGMLTWVLQQPWERIKAVSIELCLQNTTVAVSMFYLSFPGQPEADIASFMATTVSIFASVPLWVFLILRLVRQGFVKDGEVHFQSGRASVKRPFKTKRNSASLKSLPSTKGDEDDITQPDCDFDEIKETNLDNEKKMDVLNIC